MQEGARERTICQRKRAAVHRRDAGVLRAGGESRREKPTEKTEENHMKKRIIPTILALMMLLTLLPTSAAAAPTRLNHVDVTIELPKPGDPFDQSFKPTVTSFKSGNIDLLATGAGILEANWRGDNDLDENGTPYFRPGGTYYLTFKLMFNPEAGYCANYKTMSDGWNLVFPETFSATVNGQTATVSRNTSQYYPGLEVVLKLEGNTLTDAQMAERKANWAQLQKTRRAMLTSRTFEESKAYDPDLIPEKVVVVNTDGTDLNYDFKNMTTLVMDVNNAEMIADYVGRHSTLREIWLSPESNALKFAGSIDSAQWNKIKEMREYEYRSDVPILTSESTLFVSESGAQQIREWYDEGGYTQAPFTVRIYSGNDVVAAQKAGASATKSFCTKHKFTGQIRTADRICHFGDCGHVRTYYYSCAYCGVCEYDPNHVDFDQSLRANHPEILQILQWSAQAIMNGEYEFETANDAAYIGVNDVGEHVWWLTCRTCGRSYNYDMLHVNTMDQKLEGATNRTFAEYQAQQKASINQANAEALASIVTVFPDTFTLPLKSDAKMSSWAQSDVNLALNDNLIDTALLGGDYTKNITRLQFCSVAVRLAETLTGKSLPAASASTFTDTSNAYALKAYAAGITTGTTATTFEPNATLTRAQMAAFIYRTLRYVEKNSDYSYTDYTSKLSTYTDSGKLQDWAVESMAFMNALDLIKGTSATTLEPNGKCTIEQAVAVAERSVYAHLLGWYQVDPEKRFYRDGEWHAGDPYVEIAENVTLRTGDYVWVTSRHFGVYNNFVEEKYNLPYVYMEIINPFNGQTATIKNGNATPVRG